MEAFIHRLLHLLGKQWAPARTRKKVDHPKNDDPRRPEVSACGIAAENPGVALTWRALSQRSPHLSQDLPPPPPPRVQPTRLLSILLPSRASPRRITARARARFSVLHDLHDVCAACKLAQVQASKFPEGRQLTCDTHCSERYVAPSPRHVPAEKRARANSTREHRAAILRNS